MIICFAYSLKIHADQDSYQGMTRTHHDPAQRNLVKNCLNITQSKSSFLQELAFVDVTTIRSVFERLSEFHFCRDPMQNCRHFFLDRLFLLGTQRQLRWRLLFLLRRLLPLCSFRVLPFRDHFFLFGDRRSKLGLSLLFAGPCECISGKLVHCLSRCVKMIRSTHALRIDLSSKYIRYIGAIISHLGHKPVNE